MNEKNIIVWDLGATKCAAGLVVREGISGNLVCQKSSVIKLVTINSLENLIATLEEQLDFKHGDADAICIGAAGIFDGHSLHLDKGYPFKMPFAQLATAFAWPPWTIVHDYTPMVCATFVSKISYLSINQGESIEAGRRVAFGIGTGLGLKDAALLPGGDFFIGSNEMGHIGIPMPLSLSQKMLAVHQHIICKEALSFENIVSGPGMLCLHNLLNPHDKAKTPEEVGELVRTGKAPATLAYFAFYVGLFCATIQLSFMPSGGIWISGGVVAKHREIFDQPEFFMGLNAFSAYASQRKKFPLRIITDPDAVFIGGAYYAAKRLLMS